MIEEGKGRPNTGNQCIQDEGGVRQRENLQAVLVWHVQERV